MRKKSYFKQTLQLISFMILLIIFSQITNAQTRDLEIKIILNEINTEEEYDKLFRVENLDHETGTTDLLQFFLNATLQDENKTTTWNITKTINKYSETEMGTIQFENKTYKLCVNLQPLNFDDPNLINNKDCKNISPFNAEEMQQNISINQTNNETNKTNENATQPINNKDNESNITESENNTSTNQTSNLTENVNFCDCKLQIITEKQIYNSEEKISFAINDCSNNSYFENEIEYWIEDLFSDIIKTKITTTSKNPKSYTPNINEVEKTIQIKAKFTECNNTETKLVIIKQNQKNQKNTHLEIEAPQTARAGETIFIELKGYKAETLKTLINMYLKLDDEKKSDTTKFYVTKQHTQFQVKLPLKIPNDLPQGEYEYEIVTEGLNKTEINIIRIITPQREEQQHMEIKNFYTLKRKFDGTLNAKITWEGESEATFNIMTQNETKKINATDNAVTVTLKINKYDEIIIAELIKNKEVKDIKLLKLDLEIEDEIVYEVKTKKDLEKENTKNKTNNTEQLTSSNEKNIQTQKSKELQKINAENDENLTDTKNTKTKNTVTANTTKFIQENKKQTMFAIIFIISIIFLFKKEITAKIKYYFNK